MVCSSLTHHDGVDPLDVPGHDVDGGLLGVYRRVEQVVRLQVQHARRLLRLLQVDLVLVVLLLEVVPHSLGDVSPVDNLNFDTNRVVNFLKLFHHSKNNLVQK